jgi:transposase
MNYVWRRAELLQRAASMQLAQGKEPVSHKSGNREKWLHGLLEAHSDPHHRLALECDAAMVVHYDAAIQALEKELLKVTRQKASRDFALLRSVPGIGKTLALTILYEVDDINRFQSVQRFSSYCRLVKGTVASAGKIKGLRGAKLGNAYLRWAFGEAAVLAKRHDANIAALCARLEKKTGNKFKANAIMANKIGRAVYYMLKNGSVFDVEELAGKIR